MTFEELVASRKNVSAEGFELAKAAWEEAIKKAAQVARDAAKRYTCNHKKGICRAIADTIEGQK